MTDKDLLAIAAQHRPSRSFQFDVDSWLGSAAVGSFSAQQEGAFIRLLVYEWKSQDCSLPGDLDQLAKLARVSRLEVTSIAVLVLRLIKGKYYNVRLLKESAKQSEFRAARSRGGKAAKGKRLTLTTQAPLQRNTSTAPAVENKNKNTIKEEDGPAAAKFIEIKLAGGKKSLAVTEDMVEEYRQLYPYLNVRQSIKECAQYFNADRPDKQSVKASVMKARLTNWLKRDIASGKNQLAQGKQPAAKKDCGFRVAVVCKNCETAYKLGSRTAPCPKCGQVFYEYRDKAWREVQPPASEFVANLLKKAEDK